MTASTEMDNTTLTVISTSDNGNSTESANVFTSISTLRSFDDDGPSSIGLIVGLSVVAAVAIIVLLVAFVVRKKFCVQVLPKGHKNGEVRSSEQVMFAIDGSNRNSQISGTESPRTSLQGHPINPVCSFDEYVDIDPSATIEQPNSLQPDYVAVDLQPSSHNPVYEGLLNSMGEYDRPDFLQEDDAAVEAVDKTIRKHEKEEVVLNSKTRKFSLQELKPHESEMKKVKKKRNKSLPELLENNTVTMRTDKNQSKTNMTYLSEPDTAKSVNENRLNAIKEDEQKAKVSSLKSVLLEVDAYENIEIVNKQSRKRAGVASMKEQSISAESKQVPVRRAFSEQAPAPVPQPRRNVQSNRKTFDPYDYPPGVPIHKALLEEDETIDSDYIPHDPYAEETNATKRKTFDPYDYPPGFPIPKALLENGEHEDQVNTENVAVESHENDTENVFVESSGVYVEYDPHNNEENSELNDEVGGEYINCSDVVFEEENYSDNQECLDSEPTRYETDSYITAASAIEARGPPKPCSGPYYVNELVNVFDNEKDGQPGIIKEIKTDAKSEANNPTETRRENNQDITDNNVLYDEENINNSYDTGSVNENRCLANNKTDKTVSVRSDTSTTELRTEPTHKLSKSERNIPLAASKDMPHYQSDNGGIYQNLVPPKPLRLRQSLEKLDDNNSEQINKDANLVGTVNSPPKIRIQDESQDSYDYEDVLVVHKRTELEENVEHGYVNVKRFS